MFFFFSDLSLDVLMKKSFSKKGGPYSPFSPPTAPTQMNGFRRRKWMGFADANEWFRRRASHLSRSWIRVFQWRHFSFWSSSDMNFPLRGKRESRMREKKTAAQRRDGHRYPWPAPMMVNVMWPELASLRMPGPAPWRYGQDSWRLWWASESLG